MSKKDSKVDAKGSTASAAATSVPAAAPAAATADKKSDGSDRSDGRSKPNQLRAMSAECGLLSRADGSVRYSQAKTSVLVAVYGPLQATAKQEKMDRAAIEVIFKSLSGSATNGDTERASIIRSTVEGIVLTTLHPRTVISVVIQVVRDDGSLLAAAVNATCLALLNAGIACRTLVSAVCISVGKDGGLRFDPDADEEKLSVSSATLGFGSDSDLGLILSDTRGVLSESTYTATIEAGEKACSSIQSFFRLSLETTLKPKTK